MHGIHTYHRGYMALRSDSSLEATLSPPGLPHTIDPVRTIATHHILPHGLDHCTTYQHRRYETRDPMKADHSKHDTNLVQGTAANEIDC